MIIWAYVIWLRYFSSSPKQLEIPSWIHSLPLVKNSPLQYQLKVWVCLFSIGLSVCPLAQVHEVWDQPSRCSVLYISYPMGEN